MHFWPLVVKTKMGLRGSSFFSISWILQIFEIYWWKMAVVLPFECFFVGCMDALLRQLLSISRKNCQISFVMYFFITFAIIESIYLTYILKETHQNHFFLLQLTSRKNVWSLRPQSFQDSSISLRVPQDPSRFLKCPSRSLKGSSKSFKDPSKVPQRLLKVYPRSLKVLKIPQYPSGFLKVPQVSSRSLKIP